MFQETYQHSESSSSSTETLLDSYHKSEPTSPAKLSYNTFQTHTANQTACKQSLQHSQNHISDLTPALGLVLENKGSVARDHLASERTYLAYVRTSLACANAGVVLVQLLKLSSHTEDANNQSQGGMDLQRLARPLGVTMVLSGLLILIIGIMRFFMTQAALLQGLFPVARNSIAAVTFLLGAAVSIAFGALYTEMRG